MKKLNSIQFYGMPLPIYAIFAIIVLACAYFNIIPNQMIGAVAVLFAFGILIGEIGERLPIWNKFLGGGAMLCFLAAGLLKYFNLLPECVTNVSDGWINGYSFLNVFITFLVVGSLLGIDRDVLIKSGSLYIPTLLCSLLGACVFGVVAGLIFGNDPLYLITSYVLPIMGGGAGAGAVPMAQVYSDATGQDSAGYLSFCMAILALGNIVAILMAVVMDLIGRAFPKMTGHGELLRVKNKSLEVESKTPAPAVTVDDIAAAIFICAGFFMLGQLVYGSEFHKRVASYNNILYAEHTSHEFEDMEITDLLCYGENAFTCHVSFTYKVSRSGGREYEYPSQYDMAFLKTGGRWKLADLVTE